MSLSSELLPLFLELVRALVDSPSAHTEQLAAVNAALAAMQHLTNMLRPQQVRAAAAGEPDHASAAQRAGCHERCCRHTDDLCASACGGLAPQAA